MYCIFTLIGSLLLHVCFLIHVTFLGGNSSQIRNFKNHSRHYYLSQAIPPHYEISKKENKQSKSQDAQRMRSSTRSNWGSLLYLLNVIGDLIWLAQVIVHFTIYVGHKQMRVINLYKSTWDPRSIFFFFIITMRYRLMPTIEIITCLSANTWVISCIVTRNT